MLRIYHYHSHKLTRFRIALIEEFEHFRRLNRWTLASIVLIFACIVVERETLTSQVKSIPKIITLSGHKALNEKLFKYFLRDSIDSK